MISVERIEQLLTEAWAAQNNGKTESGDLFFARAIEREAERQALERAASVCDQIHSVSAVSFETGAACADAIRSLIEQSASKEKQG